MIKKFFAGIALFAVFLPANAQTAKRSMTVDDLECWQRITETLISDNGEWVACKFEPWKGDGKAELYSTRKGSMLVTIPFAGKITFSSSSSYLVVDEVVPSHLLDSLKQKKVKAEKMPMKALLIQNVNGRQERIDSLRGYSVAEKADWLAYQSGRKDSSLIVRSLDGRKSYSFPRVIDYKFSRDGGSLCYVAYAADTAKNYNLYVMSVSDGKPILVKQGKGAYKNLAFSEDGKRLAFMYCDDKSKSSKGMSLWISEMKGQAQQVAASGDKAFPDGWIISENSSVSFSKEGNRLFFGTSPVPKEKDTLTLDVDRPNVQVWSYNEPVQYTVQSYNLNRDLKKTYDAVYDIRTKRLLQIANLDLNTARMFYGMPSSQSQEEVDYALLAETKPYSVASMWEGRTKSDIYAMSLTTGEKKLLAKAEYANMRMSPKGKYAYWYADTDSCWYTIDLMSGTRYRLTTPKTFAAWNSDNDVPDYPSAYGSAGWTDNDEGLLIYDRYDIWLFDPKGQSAPKNLTVSGGNQKIQYRLQILNREKQSVNLAEIQLLSGFNETTKGYGFYSSDLRKPASPKQLIAGNYMLRSIVKAKNSDDVVYTKEDFETFPDLWASNLSLGKSLQLTHGVEQQEPFIWGTTELVEWTSLDGKKLQGVIYKPADFDPSKKYPMIVNFYERNSETLYNFHMPEPHRSTIDYHLYNSLGYVVFNPDIRYTDGHPGESCYSCLMPGVDLVVSKGYIDEKAIGAQGHSWGGYQVAYLATRTDRFAAIESGAPVVNMFSAYGGIRWGSGMARAFQYEHTQSRIGGSIWEVPELYKENSPLFNMDKVKTPILIMHNDSDGHVPWYQGIEYFVAMKRLGKPCWLINYTGEPHWPTKAPNKKDFQKRLSQFFGYFLKHETMPKWMKDGIPAVDQQFDLGY